MYQEFDYDVYARYAITCFEGKQDYLGKSFNLGFEERRCFQCCMWVSS
jgi:hypothetical protein